MSVPLEGDVLGELDILCTGLLELVRRGSEEWQLGVPHLFRQQAKREQLAPERRTVAAGASSSAA